MNEETRSSNIFNGDNFAISALCDKRSYPVVRVNSEFTEVTNGDYLFHMPTPKIVGDDLPLGSSKELRDEKERDFVISELAAKDIEKNIPKGSMPILKNVWLVESLNENTASFLMINLDVEKKISVRIEDTRFPNTESVWPKGVPEIEIGFNPEYMIKLCQQFIKSDDRKVKAIRMKIYGKLQPIELQSTKQDGQLPKALLMPCKID